VVEQYSTLLGLVKVGFREREYDRSEVVYTPELYVLGRNDCWA
jgi:hypothetical protein